MNNQQFLRATICGIAILSTSDVTMQTQIGGDTASISGVGGDPYERVQSASFTETLDEEGDYVRQELECVYTDTQLSFMKGKRGWVKEDCIILIRYSSGDVLVVGTDLVPARCTFESGGSPRTVRLSIKRNSPEFAKILESLS